MSEKSLPAGTPVAHRLAAYREARTEVERAVLPLASSVDGLTFSMQASLYDLEFARGGYVVLEGDGVARLGQVTDLSISSRGTATAGVDSADFEGMVRLASGAGRVLDSDGRPFHDALARPATPVEVASWMDRTRPPRAGLTIGTLVHAAGVPATLDAGGLSRHTFMCGQSGSGKTYSLGLLLERVLAETTLRVVILDPNSDYVHLGGARAGVDPAEGASYAAAVEGRVEVWTNDPASAHPLRMRFADLPPALQAAALGLDPVRDRDEYAVLRDLLHAQVNGAPLVADVDQFLSSEIPHARDLGRRAQNLGVLDWSIWDASGLSLLAELRDPTARCSVIDLGSLDTAAEQGVVAAAVLATLWEGRHRREPVLVVIDEAHNVCPAEPEGQVATISSAQAVQIAAEGRKFGLYLLASTQRPSKVHENVVSQCDNLLLMRMNSTADLEDLSQLFSFVPEGLVAGATGFRMGQALAVGKVLPQPAYVQMGSRLSPEGGVDIPTTWAAPH